MRFTTLLTLAAATAFTAPALAGPAPPTEEELFDSAIVVAHVESMELSCDGPAVEHEGGIIESLYLGHLRVLSVMKGDVAVDDELVYQEQSESYPAEYGEPSCGEPAVLLPSGWVGTVYLTQAGNFEVLYGGAVEDAEASAPGEVPECVLENPEEHPPTDPTNPINPTTPEDEVNPGATAGEGCSASGSPSGSPWLALGALGLALAASRRRR